jgi:hypothetical protein
VVAILDTGCGPHPWLDGIVRTDVTLDGEPIGYTDPKTSPETHPDQSGPLDGSLDPLSGHGTFIAGLVRQNCPDADIIAWRVVGSDGPIAESDWVNALVQIAELARRGRTGEPGGQVIDVLNLSMGYYHETLDDLLFDPTLREILDTLTESGTTITCSAGNDATSRPSYPAAFAAQSHEDGPSSANAPIVSVGALNPDGRSVCLFSNTGKWVSTYAAGAALVSTIPAFDGGLQPMAKTRAEGHLRESIDPDDYRGEFAVWSGTSFAAPVLAGRIASTLLDELPPSGTADDAADAVRRAWGAVEGSVPRQP